MVIWPEYLYVVTTLGLSYWLYRRSKPPTNQQDSPKTAHKGYILLNNVTHARYLPTESPHAFSYPTLSVFLNVKALTNGDLNIGTLSTTRYTGLLSEFFGHAWLFGVGPRCSSRIANIRPAAYLVDDGIQQTTLLQRLEEFGKLRSLSREDLGLDTDGDVWLMTSPSYLGTEGINPLSVWFCYGAEKQLKAVLLEVHNTFGERHVYVLRPDVNEDPEENFTGRNVEHQWTVPRQFHVSPFNDRSGYYICSLSGAAHPHTSLSSGQKDQPSSPETVPLGPLPVIRLNLLTHSKQLKLTAISRTTQAHPLTSSHLIHTFTRYPFLLLLTMVRISYHAMILHYQKGLNVFARPEPVNSVGIRSPLDGEGGRERFEDRVLSSGNPPEMSGTVSGLGVGWQAEGWLEKQARQRVDRFLCTRARELKVNIKLVAANPVEPEAFYSADHQSTTPSPTTTLTIHYLSALFFVYLMVLPSAKHTLLLGSQAEKIFATDDDELFLRTFNSPVDTAVSQDTTISKMQQSRAWLLPTNAPELPFPGRHPLDDVKVGLGRNLRLDVKALIIVWMFYGIQNIERTLYSLFSAHFVKGDEPWDRWSRLQDPLDSSLRGSGLGSVRRRVT